MKLFLKRLVGYILFLTLIFCLLLLALSVSNKRLLVKYKTEPRYNTVLLGDSHIQNAIDDSQLPYAINLSQGLEMFMFSYAKLKVLLENNPNIKRVVLGCSYHNLSRKVETTIKGKDAPRLSNRSFFLLPLKEQYWLLWHNRDNSVAFLRGVMKTGYNNLVSSEKDYSFNGFHIDINHSVDTAAIKKSVRKTYYSEENLMAFSEINIAYLNKIIDLCQSKKVELFMLNIPTHPIYNELVPVAYKEKYRSLADKRANWIEFNELQNLPDSCFITDGTHISGKGVPIVTNYVKNILNKE